MPRDKTRKEIEALINLPVMSTEEIKLRNAIAVIRDLKKRLDEVTVTLADLLPDRPEEKPRGYIHDRKTGKRIYYLKYREEEDRKKEEGEGRHKGTKAHRQKAGGRS